MNNQPNNHAGLHPMRNQQDLHVFQAAQIAMYQAYWQNQLAQMGFRQTAPSSPLPMAMAPAPAVNQLVQIKQEIEELDTDELQVIRDDLNDAEKREVVSCNANSKLWKRRSTRLISWKLVASV